MADNFMPIKRPKPGDDEEDILQMQEEFNKKKMTPCAKVINLRSKKADVSVKKQSKFANDRNKRISTSQIFGNVTKEDPENFDKIIQNKEKQFDSINYYNELSSGIVMGNIIERKINLKEFKPNVEKNLEESCHTGFPSVFKTVEKNTDSNGSLFMCAVTKKLSNYSCDLGKTKKGLVSKNSKIITGPLAAEIHKENVEKLKEMSEDEILTEQKNLEALLDPQTIAFIKSMKNDPHKSKTKLYNVCKKNTTVVQEKMEIDQISAHSLCKESMKMSTEILVDKEKVCKVLETKDNLTASETAMETEIVEKELPEPVVEIVKKAEQNGWVHMDDLEPQKVKWMEKLPQNEENNKSSEEPYNARFDFKGTLLPFNDKNLSIDEGLHHHGEEPDRPGYSLQELLQLSRSAAQQQRCTALSTLANILEKTHLGWYDQALQPPLLKTLNQKNILLMLRFSLDDAAIPVVTAALQALRAFLFCETSEICLDKSFGIEDFHEPILKPALKDVENFNSLKDHELAQIDAIAAIMRSDIILRIRFILSEMQPPPVAMTAALEILTRLARHSQETALNVACAPNLLDIVVNKSIPLSMNKSVQDKDSGKPYGCPLVAAVRLCRILIIYAGKPVIERLKNLRIIHSLLAYISSDANRQEVRLHIESLRLWRLFLHYGVEMESIVGARLTLISHLRLLSSTLNLDTASPLTCDYAAALVAMAKYDDPLKEHVAVLLAKWSTQLIKISSPTWNQTVLISEVLKALDSVLFLQRTWMLKSDIFSQISSSSNLLSDLVPAVNRNPSSLPDLAVMTYEGQLQPIMKQNSCIVFLKTVLELFIKHDCKEDIVKILENVNLQNYLRRLKNAEWSLERSWFTRLEYSFLVTIIQAENQLKTFKADVSDTIWKIAIKLISALPADCSMNVKDVLMFSLASERINLRFVESGLEKLSLTKKYQNTEELQNPSLAIKLYEKFVSPHGDWSEAAMPKDWLYLPLVDSYTRLKNENFWRPSSTIEILNLLKLELIMPELTQNLPPNLRFSRMALLYLCDTAFTQPPENELPQIIVTELVKKNYKKLDLSGDVPGLNSFTDLFIALCENFAANSYAQIGFAQIILIFIAQRYDVHYRQRLWSDKAYAMQYLNIKPDHLLIPFEEYLYPVEQDLILIDGYISNLLHNRVTLERLPIFYKIALHHAGMFLKETTQPAVARRLRLERLVSESRNKDIYDKLLNYNPSINEP